MWRILTRKFPRQRKATNLIPSVTTTTIRTTTIKYKRQYSSTSTTARSSSNDEPFYGSPRPAQSTRGNALKDLAANFLEQSSRMISDTTNPAVTSRIALTLQQATIALKDPTRADAVAAVGELTGLHALQKLKESMQQDDNGGRLILHERPVVSKATIPYENLLQQAKETADKPYLQLTFGQAYGRFLQTHEFDPDERHVVKYIDDKDHPDLAYIMLRYRQSHDFYHALTGLPPTVLGELGLKWLELWQTGLPMTAFAGTFGSLTLSHDDSHILHHHYIPWAQRVGGNQMKFGTLLNVYYEKEWDTPLVDLQQRMGIELAPHNVEGEQR